MCIWQQAACSYSLPIGIISNRMQTFSIGGIPFQFGRDFLLNDKHFVANCLCIFLQCSPVGNDQTQVTLRITVASAALRDGMFAFGVFEGGDQTLSRLDAYVQHN